MTTPKNLSSVGSVLATKAPPWLAPSQAGYELHVWARRPASLSALDGVSFTVEATPADLGAASDLIGFCLNVDDNNRDIMLSGGLLAAMKPVSVFVNHGTGLHTFAKEMTKLAAPTRSPYSTPPSAAETPALPRNSSPPSW